MAGNTHLKPHTPPPPQPPPRGSVFFSNKDLYVRSSLYFKHLYVVISILKCVLCGCICSKISFLIAYPHRLFYGNIVSTGCIKRLYNCIIFIRPHIYYVPVVRDLNFDMKSSPFNLSELFKRFCSPLPENLIN